ncbi:trigger factor [Corynebacterium suranareeae]|uniref:Trigger factor n=1 Tax=Corynebacterium suranareeae TaxID=2506452 RepID=A0A160PUG7_9CORY|nr:trigger factor [Corynebacterium suranareeae]BAU96761.1 trigger factor [Corynebacterium suranareeae]
MKSSVEKLSDTRSKITVEVPFSELKPEIDQAYAALAQQVQIPGFRKGKAPRQLIDARFGRGPVLEQVVNDMLPNRYAQAIESEGIKAIGQPNVEVTKIEDGELVEFVAEVDVRPEFDLPKFEEISVEVPAIKADDEAVDAELETLRTRFSTLKDHNHKLKKGEFVTINITASIDGEKIEEATTEGLSYEIGSDDLIDGLDKALTGAKKDETVEFTSELANGEYKGKEAQISVEITATKQRELPELDDEFAQLASEFDTIEELRESTVSDVEAKQKNEQAAAIRDEVLAAALGEADFALPQSIVDEQAHSQLHQLLGELAHDDAALNSLLEAQGTTREEFDQKNVEDAEKAVRTQLFLDTLAEVEEPEVSQQELTDHILFTAQSYGMDPNQFIGQLQQSGQIANLFADVRRGKALAQAICRVNVKDSEGNEIDPKQYFGEEEVAEAETESES